MPVISDIRVTNQEWITLSINSNVHRGLLTPLMFERELGVTVHNPGMQTKTFNSGLSHEIPPVFEQLANPQAVNGLAFTLPDYILDISLYYSLVGSDEAVVSISNDGEYLHLQSPAPIDEILQRLHSQLGQVESAILPVMLDLPVLTAWMWWAFIDLLREELEGGIQLQPTSFSLDMLMMVLGRPFEMLDNLSAYFRQCLDLRIPLKTEAQQALHSLAKKGLIEETAGGYKPGALLLQQALEFSDLQAHLLLKTSALLPDDSVGSMRNWIFQGKSGNGLLWHECQGIVSFIGVSPVQILYTVEKVLKEPLAFFDQDNSHRPAPPERLGQSKPPADTPRRPPPPERL